MKKVFFAIVVLFFGTIAVNYLLIQWDSLFSAGSPVAVTRASDSLPVLRYDFFSPSGIGQSIITQGYGATPYAYLYRDHWHDGIDIAATYGQPIYSPTSVPFVTGDPGVTTIVPRWAYQRIRPS